MYNMERFNIQFDKPWTAGGFTPPEDPLGELSDFEMGLRRFCFQHNHYISIEIVDETEYVLLFPDICLILDELPMKISELSRGKTIQLPFPESAMDIEFVPIGNKIICTLHQFGYEMKRKHFQLDRTQVLGVLRQFLGKLVQLAVDGEYISLEQAGEFLAEQSNKSGLRFNHHPGV